MGIYRKQHKDVLNWATTIGLTQLSTRGSRWDDQGRRRAV